MLRNDAYTSIDIPWVDKGTGNEVVQTQKVGQGPAGYSETGMNSFMALMDRDAVKVPLTSEEENAMRETVNSIAFRNLSVLVRSIPPSPPSPLSSFHQI